jgi:hypothetical protein
MRKLLLKS